MPSILFPEDLNPFAPDLPTGKALAMIQDVEARALRVAPCLADPAKLPDLLDAARAVLRRVVLRWHESGNTGMKVSHQQTAGPFTDGQTFEHTGSRGLFYPSEIDELRALCSATSGKAFMIDQAVQQEPTPSLATRPDLWLQWG